MFGIGVQVLLDGECCQGAFMERAISTVHLLAAGPDYRGGEGLNPGGAGSDYERFYDFTSDPLSDKSFSHFFIIYLTHSGQFL